MTSPPPPSFHLSGPVRSASSSYSESSLDAILKSQFERCRQANILRTDPLASDVLRRKIPGRLGLLAEHEPSLFARKRPATTPANVSMDQPFNPNKFHFNKVASNDEVMATVVDDGQRPEDRNGIGVGTIEEEQVHRILVNVSPLMYGHGLLVPWSERCLPQQLTSDAVELAIRLLRRSIENLEEGGHNCCSDSYCVGFNSLGAFSSVNHLHLHILYPSELDHAARGEPLMGGRKDFPIAYAPVERRVTNYYHGMDCQIDELHWTVPCFAFSAGNRNDKDVDFRLQQSVSRFVAYLHGSRIPYNVLFIQENGSIRCIVIPRKHQDNFDKEKHGFNAALGEISGMLIARTADHFHAFVEAEIEREMREYVAVKGEDLSNIYSELRGGDSCGVIVEDSRGPVRLLRTTCN